MTRRHRGQAAGRVRQRNGPHVHGGTCACARDGSSLRLAQTRAGGLGNCVRQRWCCAAWTPPWCVQSTSFASGIFASSLLAGSCLMCTSGASCRARGSQRLFAKPV
eukprot:15436664-Alexandrium_andersonii.AAC.1